MSEYDKYLRQLRNMYYWISFGFYTVDDYGNLIQVKPIKYFFYQEH